jgi:hypothetical protein
MFKNHPFIYNSHKAAAIMLTLFFVVMGTCSIQKIISLDSLSQVESFKQPKTTLNLSNNQTTCSFKNEIVKEQVLLVKNNSTKDSASLFLHFTLIFGLFTSFLRNTNLSFKKTHPDLLVPSLPLFLQYRTLII